MLNPRSRACLVAAVPLALAACGGGDSTAPGTVDSVSALVGDVAFSATSSSASSSNGTVSIQAQGSLGGVVRSLTISVQASSPGTFTVGSAGSASVQYSETASGTTRQWEARSGSGSGTLTLSVLSATRVVGTLSATLAPVVASGATASKSLANGAFSISLAGGY